MSYINYLRQLSNLKYIDISGGSWYDKNRNKSAISRKGDGYGIGTGNKIP